jgi:hypothetical protein
MNFRQLWPELPIALVAGGTLAIGMLSQTTAIARYPVAGDMLILVGTLLGLIFAGATFVVTLFAADYVRLLSKAPGGVLSFFRPFILAIGSQISTVLLAVGYRALGQVVPSKLEDTWFTVLCLLFAYAIIDIMALSRSVVMHALTRAKQLEMQDEDSAPNVRRLPQSDERR